MQEKKSGCFFLNTVYKHLYSSNHSLRLFAGHENAGTENIYNGCQINDRTLSLAVYFHYIIYWFPA